MEDEITNLKNMIENAKKENDLVLVEFLTKALNHILEKQKEQEDIKLKSQENINQEEKKNEEEKKEVIVEEKKEEKEEEKEKDNIIGQLKGEVSTLNKYSTGNIQLESPYMDIKVNSSNPSLKIQLEHVLVTLALDDVSKEKKSIVELYEILKKYNKEEDILDINNFLSSISSISTVGKTTSEAINSFILDNDLENNSDLNEAFNNSFDTEYEKLSKNISILNMDFDELHNKSTKDPEEYREILLSYQQKLRELETLYDETYNKVDSKKSTELMTEINQLKEKISNIKDYIQRLDDLVKETENAFDF